MLDYKSHYSVLKKECLDFLYHEKISEQKGNISFADLTFGAGGHSLALASLAENIRVIGCDQDPDALKNGRQLIKECAMSKKLDLVASNFEHFFDKVKSHHFLNEDKLFNGILMDLGVSSHHFDSPDRGFSYRFDGPLDMRMNTSDNVKTAASLVNSLDENELVEIFEKYGEEKLAKTIAKNIVEKRSEKEIKTTKELEDIIFHSYPKKWRYGRTNPSTKVFQALRIAVNEELEVLEKALACSLEALAQNGRLCVITFHSLEDRIVKHFFRKKSREYKDKFRLLTKKPILPTEKELKENKRSRSAKLRVIERI